MSINNSYNLSKSRYDNYNSPNKPIQIGGSLIIDKGIDLSKYINKVENLLNSEKKLKKQNRSTTIENYTSSPLNRYQYGVVFPPLKNQSPFLGSVKRQNTIERNNNKNKTITTQYSLKTSGYPLTGLNIIKNKQTLNIRNYPISSEKTLITDTNNINNINKFSFYKSKNFPIKSGEVFNISKVVKSIKKSVDLSHKDKSLKTFLNGNFAYDESHLKEVFEPNKLINNYYTHVQTTLNQDDNNLLSFVDKNKQISVNNVLINLLKDEKSTISKNQTIHEQKIIENTKIIENNEKEFDEYQNVQKIACRKIENLLSTIYSKNRRLLEEERNAKAELKVSEDERVKVLEMIDELRIIAKFVHKVLGDNDNIFKSKILPNDFFDPPDYEEITKNVFIRFKNFLSDDKNENILSILNEPEVLIRKFREIEDNIIRGLNIGGKYMKQIQIIKDDREKIEKDINEKCVDLELEYEKLKEIYNNDLTELNDILKRENPDNNDNDDCNELVRDLFTEVVKVFKPTLSNKFNGISANKISPRDCASETKRILIENERKVYNLIFNLAKIETNDPKIFNEILDERKSINKEKKLNMYKKNLEDKQAKIITKNEGENKRIVFLSRKTEPPFHFPKKVKIVKDDKKLIEMQENQELMAYE